MSLRSKPLYPRMVRKPPFTVEVPDIEPVDGETIPRRNVRCPDKLQSQPEEGTSTVWDIVKRSASKFGDRRALGSRNLIKKHNRTTKVKKLVDGKLQEVDKNWTYFELSGYNYMSFKEYETFVTEIGAGLRKLGLVSYDRVHMFAATRQVMFSTTAGCSKYVSAHWISLAHGAMSQSMAVVTAYDTLGEEALRHSLVATKAKAIFLEPHLLKTVIGTLKDAKSIEHIILNSGSELEVSDEDLSTLKKFYEHVNLLTFEDLRRLGEENLVDPTPPSPDDLCCIMYTSGSGGTPKGVELKHKNVVASVAGINVIVGDYVGPDDALLSYLPLAHIFEFVMENAALQWGTLQGYGSSRTLSQANCVNCKGDIQEFKPTILVGIPAIWETVRKGVIENVNKSSVVARSLFWAAFAAKRLLVNNGLPGSTVLDTLVFNRVKEATGGRLRLCLNGAAPIARETQEFISMAICPMISGYGMTETTANGTVCDPGSWTLDAHGDLPGSIEVKLVDFPDAGYYATNKPNPQGEIWIRGPSVMERYYENEELTNEFLAPGGWFMTGDIGEWDANGHLKVIDRKKNLVKTLNGEYIALEKLEAIYRSVHIVGNICVYASISESKPIAVVVPVEATLKQLANSVGATGDNLRDLAQNERVRVEVLKQMQTVGKRAGLANIEIIEGVVLSEEEWTTENNLITPTIKLNRRAIFEKYQKEISVAYKKT